MSSERRKASGIEHTEGIHGFVTDGLRKRLKTCCDWILENRGEHKDCRWVSAWYQISYPLRALLAGYEILGDKKYLDAVIVCLDKLLGEQLPNFSWECSVHNVAIKDLSRENQYKTLYEWIVDNKWSMNLADIGSIVTCLACAFPHVDIARRKAYLEAQENYSNLYALQGRLMSGAFCNSVCGGEFRSVPYSVATGTQGMNFCSLYAVTHKERYLKIAVDAAKYLLREWSKDGRPIHHHHYDPIAGEIDVTQFGDVYYYHEAILWVLNWTNDESLKEKIRKVYAWHIKGEKGLLKTMRGKNWWPSATTGNLWESSKSCAMPLVLMAYDRFLGDDNEVKTALRKTMAFLTDHDLSRKLGVMRRLSLRDKKSCKAARESFAATGFAGMSLAEYIKPGVIFGRGSKRKYNAV